MGANPAGAAGASSQQSDTNEGNIPETQEAPAGSQGQPGVPNSSSTPPAALTPGASPPGTSGSKPAGHSSNSVPNDADQSADARTSNVAAEEPNSAPAAGPLDVPGVRSILSRISGALQAGADMTAPASPPAKSGK
jgi:hypothetical protein